MRLDKLLYRKTIFSYLLYPVSLIYGMIVAGKRKRFRQEKDLLKTKLLIGNTKLISVGNILVGGSGKTPFTIFLAKTLLDSGYKVAVSHRGYKGRFEESCHLISDYSEVYPEASDAGDEPLLLAENLKGIPVIAGKNRFEAVHVLTKHFPELDYIILDDSFQHHKVVKDFNFIMFNDNLHSPNKFLLPAGPYREDMTALKDADVLVYMGTKDIELTRFRLPIMRGSYTFNSFRTLDNRSIDIQALLGKKIALLSAIGQPDSFEKTIKSQGIDFCRHFTYPDHYDYGEGTIQYVKQTDSFDYIITTEKDAVKLRYIKTKLPFIVASVSFSTNTTPTELISMIQGSFR